MSDQPKTRTRHGVVALVTLYGTGRDGDGWCCRSCSREFRHHGKRKLRLALAVLDHVVLDHKRLPAYRHPGWVVPPAPMWIPATPGTTTYASGSFTLTTPYSVTFNGWRDGTNG